MKVEKNWIQRICPYLGNKIDPGTALSYPSALNFCYHARKVAPIDLGHQAELCLTNGYPSCLEYARDPEAALPTAYTDSSAGRTRKIPVKNIWVLSIILLGLGIIAAWWLFNRPEGSGNPLIGSTVTFESTETYLASTFTFLPQTDTPVNDPTIAITATSRPALELDTPLGLDHKYIIHQVHEGETLSLIASQYGTTRDVLQASNYLIPSPIWLGWAIVVPVNMVDAQGLPVFEAYGVTEEISLEDLAIQLSVDLNDFKYYNAIGDDFIPMAGDWFLVPRVGLPTP
jgi:hypothetical protein